MRNCIDGRKEFYDDKLKRVEYVDDDQADVTPLPAMVPVEWVRLEDVWRQFGQAFVDACIATRWKTTLSESPLFLSIRYIDGFRGGETGLCFTLYNKQI